MEQIQQIFGDEKFITNSKGEIESVLMTLSEYNKIFEGSNILRVGDKEIIQI